MEESLGPDLTRRALLKYSALGALGGTTWLLEGAKAAERECIVRTTAGRVRGLSTDGLNVFKGIPYGASTAGRNRFMPPQKPVRWAGVRDALHPGPLSMQLPAMEQTPPTSAFRQLCRGAFPSAPYNMSEDSLTLNIWSAGLGNQSQRPVMVWLHPGGYSNGAGYSAWADGAHLARRRDVVVVSLNHRLNIFGWLYLGDVGGARYAESGNVGMLDIVAALNWIQDNIARFGGDPGRVTVFGESGGGGKVSVLMAMPAARGLFHRAIVQSGSKCRLLLQDDAARTTANVLTRLKIDSRNLDELHRLPAQRLLQAMDKDVFAPNVSGSAVPRHPFDPDAPAVSADVPMLIGTNKNEGTWPALLDPTVQVTDEATLRSYMTNTHLADTQADRLVQAYRAAHPQATPWDLAATIVTDTNFRSQAIRQAGAKAAQGKAPVHMYLFSWESPAFGGRYGSAHTFDTPFVFDNLEQAPELCGAQPDPGYYRLASNLSQACAAFAHTADPNHPGLPPWQPYTLEGRATLVLDDACHVENDPRREDRLALERITSHA